MPPRRNKLKQSAKAVPLAENPNQSQKDLYGSLVQSLLDLPPCYPVIFTSLRHKHLNGDVAKKQGIFVRLFDVHELDQIEAENKANDTNYESPAIIVKMAAMSACSFDGTRIFDPTDRKHLELLTAEGKMTEAIWYRCMYANGFYERVVTQIAKNSDPTVLPSSDSGSVSN